MNNYETISIFSNTESGIERIRWVLDNAYKINDFDDITSLKSHLKDCENELVIIHLESAQDALHNFQYIKNEYPTHKFLALCDETDYNQALLCINCGIKGYGSIYMHQDLMKQVIEVVKNGNIWLCPIIMNRAINVAAKKNSSLTQVFEKLTKKESEVAKMVLDGLENSEIAEKMQVSERTVKAHLKNIYEKTNAKNRLSFALKALNSR